MTVEYESDHELGFRSDELRYRQTSKEVQRACAPYWIAVELRLEELFAYKTLFFP